LVGLTSFSPKWEKPYLRRTWSARPFFKTMPISHEEMLAALRPVPPGGQRPSATDLGLALGELSNFHLQAGRTVIIVWTPECGVMQYWKAADRMIYFLPETE
jgi:hypothetical protein